MGHWIKKVDRIHRHDFPTPTLSNQIHPGSVWECDCGRRFILDESYEWRQDYSTYTENDIFPDFMKEWIRDIYDR